MPCWPTNSVMVKGLESNLGSLFSSSCSSAVPSSLQLVLLHLLDGLFLPSLSYSLSSLSSLSLSLILSLAVFVSSSSLCWVCSRMSGSRVLMVLPKSHPAGFRPVMLLVSMRYWVSWVGLYLQRKPFPNSYLPAALISQLSRLLLDHLH